MPSGVRSVLGLQLDLPPRCGQPTNYFQELIAMLHNDNMPAELCTIGIEGANARAMQSGNTYRCGATPGLALGRGALRGELWIQPSGLHEQ